jgi:hypothetical protein
MNKYSIADKMCAELPPDCDTLLLRAKIAESRKHPVLEDKEKDKNEQDAMEYYIVSNLYLLRPSVKVLKNEYPECFAMPIIRASVKIGRNESCPRGSGKKIKMLRKKLAPFTILRQIITLLS